MWAIAAMESEVWDKDFSRATRARLAVARGIRYLQVDASASSRPILERLGFVAVTTTTPYVWSPGAIGSGQSTKPARTSRQFLTQSFGELWGSTPGRLRHACSRLSVSCFTWI